MKRWLEERLRVLLPQLEERGVAQEEEIARLCADEIAAWRARPQMKEASSLRVPMTDTRKAIKELDLTESNRWRNPRTGEWEHLALKYMNFSEEEWAAMNAGAAQDFHARVNMQQLLEKPWDILQRAEELLGRPAWEEVVVGLAVVTGRRLTEVLKTGSVHPRSVYTLTFSGQLKRRDVQLDPYEIPTLMPADQVLAAWARVRTEVDCTGLDTSQVSATYSQQVGDAARRAFSGLVPVRTNDEDVYTHLFRTVYVRLAVWLYCPPHVMDLTYMATIQGHYWALSAETEEKRLNYMSTLHYNDYKIGDGQGNIDGRQGIRLGEPGVKVLDVFEQTPPQQQTKTSKAALPVRGASRTGYGLLKPKQATKARFEQVQQQTGKKTQDETLTLLLDDHALYEQVQALVQPMADQLASTSLLETMQALVAASVAQRSESQAFEERWGVTLAEVSALFEQVDASGETRPVTMVFRELLDKQQQRRQTYQQRRQETRYDQMPYSELRGRKEPEAVEERVRRAVGALMRYNEQCEVPELRWYINPSIVHELVGGRHPAIQASLEAHRDEIEEHHEALQITPRSNLKGRSLVAQRVYIPEMPALPFTQTLAAVTQGKETSNEENNHEGPTSDGL